MTDQSKNQTVASEKKTYAVKAASLIAMLAFIVVLGNSSSESVSQKTLAAALLLSIFLEIISIAAMLELALESAMALSSFRWGLAAMLAVIGFLAKTQTMADLNAIFHIDPSALPMTLAAGTAIRFATYLLWPMLVITAISAAMLLFYWIGKTLRKHDDIARIDIVARTLFAFIASGLAALIILLQFSDHGIKTKLYRLSHDADFNAAFDCRGFKADQLDALFIGPEQRRALFAPKLPHDTLFVNTKETPEFLRPVKIPQSFVIADCVSTITSVPDLNQLESAPGR